MIKERNFPKRVGKYFVEITSGTGACKCGDLYC